MGKAAGRTRKNSIIITWQLQVTREPNALRLSYADRPQNRLTAVLAVDIKFSNDTLHVRLSDGREVSVPLEWFPRLRDATPAQRANWRLIAHGIGIHWEDIDEDIAVTTLMRIG